MALVNEIYAPRFNKLLHKLLGMKGPDPSPQLTPEISPELALETDRFEWRMLSDTFSWVGQPNQAAGGAGIFSLLGVRNPTGSGKLVVIEGWYAQLPAGANIFSLLRAATALAVFAPAGFRDSRGTQGVTMLLAGTEAAAFAQTFQATLSGIVPISYCLFPGFEFVIEPSVAMTALGGSFWGYERPIEPAESNP